MKRTELTHYRSLLSDIKTRVRTAQHRAALSANAEMIRLYWEIGRLIAARQEQEGWGAGVIPRLAVDLNNELPEEKGFSERNIKRMVQFSSEYPELYAIGPQPVDQLLTPSSIVHQSAAQLEIIRQAILPLSWTHNVLLIQKLKDLPTRLWYARQALEQGWSRAHGIWIVELRKKNSVLPSLSSHNSPFTIHHSQFV